MIWGYHYLRKPPYVSGWCHVCWDIDQTSRFGSPPIWRTFWHPRFNIFFAWAGNFPDGSMMVWTKQMTASTFNIILVGSNRKILLAACRHATFLAAFSLFIQEVLQWCLFFDWRRPSEFVALLLFFEGNPQWPQEGLSLSGHLIKGLQIYYFEIK